MIGNLRRIIQQLFSVQYFTRYHNFFSGEKILRRILLSVCLYASGSDINISGDLIGPRSEAQQTNIGRLPSLHNLIINNG